MDKQKKKQLAKYLSQKTVNTSSRKRSIPTDYEAIVSNGCEISGIGLSFNTQYHQLTVRVEFVGSEKWFTLGVERDKYYYWSKIIEELTVSSVDIDIFAEVASLDATDKGVSSVEYCDICHAPLEHCRC